MHRSLLEMRRNKVNIEYYLKRQKIKLQDIIVRESYTTHEELEHYFLKRGVKGLTVNMSNLAFKDTYQHMENQSVEKRTVVESDSEKKRVSNKKSSKSKSNASPGARGSGTKQRIRKSTPKRQRKRNSNKVESVQSTSGSEDTK